MNQTQIEELVTVLTAKVDGYIKPFQQVQAQTIETTKHIQDATEKVKGFTESVTSFSQAALAGIASLGVAHWFKEVFDLAGSTEQQFLGLTAAIRANTDDVDHTVEAYKRFADGMFEVTGTSKRTTLALLQMDEMQGLTAKRAMETAKQAIALSAATGMDPRSLIGRINMAETGSGIRMLQRVPGIKGMTDEVQMVEKANRLMAIGMEVSKAQMQSAAGMVRKLSEELEEVKKQFGKLLLDALKPIIELLTKTVQWFKDLDERTKLVILSLAGMTTGVVALVNGLKLLNAATALLFSGTGGLLAVMLPIAVAAALWVEHLGGVSKAWDLVKAKAQQFWDWVGPLAEEVWGAIRIGAMVMAQAAILAWKAIAEAFEPLRELLVAGWNEVCEAAEGLSDELGGIWEPLEVAAASYAATLAAVGAALYWAIPKSLEELLPLGLRVFGELASYAWEMLPDVVDAIEDAVSKAVEAIRNAGSEAGSVLASIGAWFSSLPAKIQGAMNWIADTIQLLPPLINQIAKDLTDLAGVAEVLARAFRWINDITSGVPRGVAAIATLVSVAVMLTAGFSKITMLVTAINLGLAVFGDKFVPLVVFLASKLFGVSNGLSLILGIVTLLAARTDLVWQALGKVQEFFKWIAGNNEWIKNLADKLSGSFRWVGASIGPAMTAIGGFFTSLWQPAVTAFDLIKSAASEAFGVVQEVAGGVFEALSEVVANFNWNLQNTIIVVAATVGVVAAMATVLLVWGVAAKVVTVSMALMTLMMLPQKLALIALNILWAVLDGLLVITGVKLVITTAGWLVYQIAILLVTSATGLLILAKIALIAVMSVALVVLIAISAALVSIVVGAFMGAASAVMALVDALKVMTLFTGAADAFSHWKSILGGLVMAIQVDMGLAWKHVQDAMHLAGEEVKAFWPPVWARIKEGFFLLWDAVAAKFKQSINKHLLDIGAVTLLIGQTEAGLKQNLKEATNDLDEAMKGLDKLSKNPIDLSKITSPGMEADLARIEANVANTNELVKLKKAATEEADRLAKKHKEELDTATRLNNLAQQHNELKRAELVVANSAEAIYRIQAYRIAQQAALEARAAKDKKDALDKEPDKGPAQLALEVGIAAAKRNEDVVSAVAKAQIASASNDKEAALIAAQWARRVGDEYNKALDGAKNLNELLRVMERFGKAHTEAELARSRTDEKTTQTSVASATTDTEKKMLEARAMVATVDKEYMEALAVAKSRIETVAISEKFVPLLDRAIAEDTKASKEYIDSLTGTRANGLVPTRESGNAEGLVGGTLLRIEELLKGSSKKPTLEVKPVDLRK